MALQPGAPRGRHQIVGLAWLYGRPLPRFSAYNRIGGRIDVRVEEVLVSNSMRFCSLPLLVLVAGLLAVGCAAEAPEAVSAPPPAGLPEASAQELVRDFQHELDRLWQAAQDSEENFPGATAAFVLDDGRVFAFATGFSDVEAEIEMTPDLLMPSGSIGKTYVAAVGLQLAQQGRLDLDEPIATWLGEEPWFSRVPNGPDLTLRILLSHTGGLIDHAFESEDFTNWAKTALGDEGSADTYLRPRELVEFALDKDPLFAPGEGFHYTDTGYILAGIAMEAATGSSYYDLLRELFLEPLRLDLTLPADRRDLPNLAQGYAHESSQFFGTPLRIVGDEGLAIHPLSEWTGGGLVNNPQALVRWAKALYEGDAIEGDELSQLLDIGFAPDPENPESGYGLGVSIGESERHGRYYGHGGFYPGYNSRVAYFPDYGVAVAVQINSDKSELGPHSTALAALVLDALDAAEAGAGGAGL